MTRLPILLLVLLLPGSLFARELDESALLDAIAMVETGNRDMVGRAGERGAHQLTPAVVRRVGGYNRAAAMRWLAIVKRDMARYHIHLNALNAALIWNAGIHAVRQGRAPVSSYQYAVRVRNLHDSLLTERRKGVE